MAYFEPLSERNQKEDRSQQNRAADISFRDFSGMCTFCECGRGLLVQLSRFLEQWIVILGREAGTRLRVYPVERVGLEPGVKRDAVLGAEPTDIGISEFLVLCLMRLEPVVEDHDIQQSLLSAFGGSDPGLHAQPRGVPIQERLT